MSYDRELHKIEEAFRQKLREADEIAKTEQGRDGVASQLSKAAWNKFRKDLNELKERYYIDDSIKP